ncbi:unnamed protein product [Macrosiphum euphorbiae]|uniref:Uncharacterized protein n=1 Tax=Macrosiphum euphorbiae TaxID=13131 RepID=A0AAV0WEC6_9HEMI|nr:unnamed protein product [Macrosiphum euphorbiae]CAI6355917.1 unnamed protein product [Macrosiphum euphorbiae]CAI6359843.1 unnamed protein product [Macrosiphum euphorbiae]
MDPIQWSVGLAKLINFRPFRSQDLVPRNIYIPVICIKTSTVINQPSNDEHMSACNRSHTSHQACIIMEKACSLLNMVFIH